MSFNRLVSTLWTILLSPYEWWKRRIEYLKENRDKRFFETLNYDLGVERTLFEEKIYGDVIFVGALDGEAELVLNEEESSALTLYQGRKLYHDFYRLFIKDLVSGLNNVTIIGRVISVSPLQSFTRYDGSVGSVRSLLITDKSGKIKVVLWDDKANIRYKKEDLIGRTVKFSHGYIREGQNGRLEFNIGSRGNLEIFHSKVSESRSPLIGYSVKRDSDVSKNDKKF